MILRSRRTLRAVAAGAVVLIVSLGLLAACGEDRTAAAPETIHVPADVPSIQAAVDAADPGDLVLVAPGTYHEEVTISRPRVVLRGEDRNQVVLDGEGSRSYGVLVTADGVAVENLTVTGYQINGLFFNGVSGPGDESALQGYRASYVTAYDNGLYGIYAFQARNGRIDHSYASGHPDSGIYVGQCRDCQALVTDVVAEHNAVGYEGTNASGDVWVVNSVFRANRVGVTPNSQSTEALAPQGDAVIAGNLVVDNASALAPEQASGGFGLGIAVGGGSRDTVIRNRVTGHPGVGIAVTDLASFMPSDVRVEGNVTAGNAVDLAYYLSTGPQLPSSGNCWTANQFASSIPEAIETRFPCGSAGPAATVTGTLPDFPASPEGPDSAAIPRPPPQPGMPDPGAAAEPAVDVFVRPDLDRIQVPAA